MLTIADRIKQRMSALNINRQKDLAERAGVSTVQISNVLNGSRGFGADALLNVSTALECDPYWLLFGKGNEPQPVQKFSAEFVPTLEWQNLLSWLDGNENAVAEMVPCPARPSDKTFAYRVIGEAMAPLFSTGDLIFVDGSQRLIESGAFVLVFVAGDVTVAPILRQVQQIDNSPFYVAMNKDLPGNMKFTACSEEDIIAGKITGSYKQV